MASPPQTAANGEKPQRRGEVHLTTKSMYGHRPLNGLPPDVPSWGTMLSREGRQYMLEMGAAAGDVAGGGADAWNWLRTR